MHHRHNFYILH